MANRGRKPDYTLSAMCKINRDAKGRIGAAWTQDDGSIQIKLDPFVCLQGEAVGGEALFVTLYPQKERSPAEVPPPPPTDDPVTGTSPLPEERQKGGKPGKFDDLEDDIPF